MIWLRGDASRWWFWFLRLKEVVVASVWGRRKVRDSVVLFFILGFIVYFLGVSVKFFLF